ncbi:hypothetical protein PB01_16720 [Psychrobacillus glaciei]|uniref:Uncharacterized protein n=1 Tax=Psychrobacillus glaciei TaxID=2283160 RepID=A0A5J6SQW4_9BACI|nr:hypothetical protein [Psychrobacillus glaciei]QFG00321.1 hypothetical protein PB01_16720 [Psychrobacillus glaciei]
MPILREFDLDIPYVKSSGDKEDYEKNWKQQRREFRDEIRCVASLFECHFEKFKTEKCWKLLVECVERIVDERVIGEDICIVQVELNIERYFQLSNIEKKKLILKLLKNGIEKIIDEKGWNKQLFESAYQQVIDCNYINERIWKQPKKSPNRKHIAEVFCEHDIDKFEISIIVKNNEGEVVKREKLITERPNEWAFTKHFGKLKWISSNEVTLVNKNESKQWIVQI